MGRLQTIYHNLMKLDYDNTRTRSHAALDGAPAPERRSPLELFEEFNQLQNNQPMSPEQARLVQGLMEQIWEETP